MPNCLNILYLSIIKSNTQKNMYFIGYDIGSSSVKACLVSSVSGEIVASDFFPKQEMPILAVKAGWAEQDPESWWNNLKLAHKSVVEKSKINSRDIRAIGITWQMHGLVVTDDKQNVLRPSIIWCDSRAVSYGETAFNAIGHEKCLSHLLNSPGNFTASKLAWVKENEADIYSKIDKLMLPGDYIAMKLTGTITTTIEGLSEGMLWDFKNKEVSKDVLSHFGIPSSFIPDIRPNFGTQGFVDSRAAQELGLDEGIPITYRAGDQPNNAFALNVMNPGEIAANAGTSGVIYGVLDHLNYDKLSRVNSFAHVNYTTELDRIGVLLCINGTGILNSWLKKNLACEGLSYDDMNKLAAESTVGARGVSIIPFGNGVERVMQNKEVDCSIHGINFNIHDKRDLLRAAQEGIVFSYAYGLQIMRDMGMEINTIKAGHTNMFLSPIFAQALSSISGSRIELYDTDGAAGAARGAGVGLGHFESHDTAFENVNKIMEYHPEKDKQEEYQVAYERWLEILLKQL